MTTAAQNSRLHPLSLLTAMFLVFALLFGGVMAASPELHHAVHADSGHSQHQCLATVLAQQGVEVTHSPVALPSFSPALVWQLAELSVSRPTSAYDYAPGARGPPSSSL